MGNSTIPKMLSNDLHPA